VVKQEEKFREMLLRAELMVKSKKSDFVFIAQKPRFANQNMGWIEVGELVEKKEDVDIYTFQRLCYRPTLEEAERFFADKKFVWNLGYFVTTPKTLVSLYQAFTPQMYTLLQQIQQVYGTAEYTSVCKTIYPQLEKISFDDAILVKLRPDTISVLSSDLGWSDVGAWEALKEALSDSMEENVTKGNVILEDTTDTLAFNYNKQLIVGIDLQEMLVVNTGDVLLVCPKTSVPKIKKTSNLIKNIELVDKYENKLTLRITYHSDDRQLASSDLIGVRNQIEGISQS
jgi:mannose-1-phosphate guanylyltransferase